MEEKQGETMEYVKICPVCGKTFKTGNELYTYCGPECRVTARRKREREYRRAERASARPEPVSEEYKRARSEESEKRSQRSKEDFERRCNEGDPHALLIREKALRGNRSRRYWELFAKCEIDWAERSGTVSRLLVNGYSVYSDTFAEDVMESIQAHGPIVLELGRKNEHK